MLAAGARGIRWAELGFLLPPSPEGAHGTDVSGALPPPSAPVPAVCHLGQDPAHSRWRPGHPHPGWWPSQHGPVPSPTACECPPGAPTVPGEVRAHRRPPERLHLSQLGRCLWDWLRGALPRSGHE